MKFLISLLISCLLFSASAAAADSNRWILAGNDSPNNNAWYIDSKTLKVHDNSTIFFWAKVLISNPKYDITEIKIKYLLSADRLQLTKLEEIGYSNTGEIIWNNNLAKTISVVPGSGPEKLVIFVENFVSEQAAQKAQAAAKQQPEANAAPVAQSDSAAVLAEEKAPIQNKDSAAVNTAEAGSAAKSDEQQ